MVYVKVDLGVVVQKSCAPEAGFIEAPDYVCCGYLYDGVNFTAPPPTLAKVKIDQSTLISASAQTAIIGGFASAALGASNTYPSTLVDQQNINAVALVGGSLWCADATGKWSFMPHTKAQAASVQADMVAHIQTQQAKNATKQAALAAATTEADVAKVIW